MTEVKEKAVIDADFFNKITNDGKTSDLFKAVMNELSFAPIMHRYVYEYELAANSAARTMVEEGFITIEDEGELLSSNPLTYNASFCNLYYQMNNSYFPSQYDVCNYHHSGENLGEIRSSLLAFFKGYHYFMSDDRGARYYIMNRFPSQHSITVMNLFDTFVRIGELEKRSIKWKDIKGILKEKLRKEDFEHLRSVWVD